MHFFSNELHAKKVEIWIIFVIGIRAKSSEHNSSK